ncbi:sensor histidine kinase [Subtercola boreus]|uniref:histidine kinase n=1 Tax=Subtercola boreus TaxID=120213 RepID=A0A3E0W9Y8_9MICO|nr:HAMP domain-containing sensor histidine kinase [Subtercola boreus]RFA19309.1 two-component sensor histidine kinase [Subtercola boreus]RFA19570.1 two-component sensor histidine kinase [Subtercola boreus]RFA25935.1 two-component sensor histidine kinase [Subtercola boreus]
MAVTPATFWGSISLRTKITGVTVLLLTVGLVVAGIGTMTVLRQYLLQQVDKGLSVGYDDVSTFLGKGATKDVFTLDTVSTAPTTYYVALLGPDGSITASNWGSQATTKEPNLSGLQTTPGAEVQAEKPVYEISSSDGKDEWHAIVRTIGFQDQTTGTMVIAASLEKTDSITTTYLSIFLAFSVGVVVLGALLTRLLVTSTFAPLRAVERTAAEIADGDFSQRMSNATPNTEVGRLNRSLNTMLSRIDTAFSDRAKTIEQMRRFVGDASHELRTPLVSVRGYAELYRMGALQSPEEVAKAMDRIEKEAIRMGALVEDLLELARLDETRPLNLTSINLVPIAVDAALDARASSPERVVSIILPRSSQPVSLAPAADAATNPYGMTMGDIAAGHAELAGDKPPVNNLTGPISFAGATIARLRGRRTRGDGTVELTPTDVALSTFDSDDHEGVAPVIMADENKIRQVVANLIGNALRFTASDSPIEVSVQVDEAKRLAVLDVIDHGEGIPPQIREKIFQRFWRADSSRTRETGGSGLGLAIVASIIAAHHGTVEAVETAGGGATFRVSLPLVGADAPTAATS